MQLDHEQCYRAVQSRDARFDGWFVTAVRTTGIYCRPSCPAITPKQTNVEFFLAAATAQQHGYRACKRCRPDATPGSPEWNARADVVGRAMRLIADGLVDRDGVGGLARRLGYSERQINRLLVAEVGTGPLALARAQRAQTARVLIETTDMPITDVAFAAGFASVRQFNDTIRTVFAANPTDLRRRRRATSGATAGELVVRLARRSPFDAASLFEFLGRRAVAGVEHLDEHGTYRRSMRLAHGSAVVALTPTADAVLCALRLDDVADAQSAVQRCRRMLDLDSDPVAIDAHLGAHPLLAGLVVARPGLRSPGHPAGDELLVRALLGQQISVGGARTLAARLVARSGEQLTAPVGAITHLFPSAAAVAAAAAGPDRLAMPRARAAAIVGACQHVADGRIVLDAGSDRDEVRSALVGLPGIGPWTADYVVMRALGDPDVFMATDLGVRHSLAALGADPGPSASTQRADSWKPFRSYALHHLWAALTPSSNAPASARAAPVRAPRTSRSRRVRISS